MGIIDRKTFRILTEANNMSYYKLNLKTTMLQLVTIHTRGNACEICTLITSISVH